MTASSITPRPFRFSVTDGPVTRRAEWVDHVRKAEDLGFSAVSVSDHFDDQLGPIAALMCAAEVTERLKLLPLVFCNDYRHPVVLAKEAATLDLLSEGRLEFGLGAGWMTSDYEGAGIPLDTPGTRIRRLEESVGLIRSLWSGEEVHHDGEFYSVHGIPGRPVPAQERVPVVIGGGGPKVLGVAGRHADIVGLNPKLTAGRIDASAGPSATAEATERKIGWIRDGAGDRFGEIELHCRVHLLLITEDRDGVYELMSAGFGLTPDEARDTPHALVGTHSQVAEQMRRHRERFGISYWGLSASAMDDAAPIIEELAGD